MKYLLVSIMAFLVLFFVSIPVAGNASSEEAASFHRILKMDMQQLTEKAQNILSEKYPSEDWSTYSFPEYVYSNESVETGYKVAVKETELLNSQTCYCFCEAVGHESLLYCFFKNGDPEAGFDSHAFNCNICYSQALRALVFRDAGYSPEQIQQGFQIMYGHE